MNSRQRRIYHPPSPGEQRPVATYSIVARDPRNGDLGVATQSKFLAVGSIVPWAQAGVGAIATQAMANFTYGPDGLALLAQGLSAQEAMEKLISQDPGNAHRQLGIVDANGDSATYTGEQCLAWAGGRAGPNYACQGNILVGEETVAALEAAFLQAAGEPLAERLIAALAAAQAAGGDRRGQQSAALLVVRKEGGYGGNNDRYIDLRVDDHPQPVEELRRLLGLHRLLFEKTPTDSCLPASEGLIAEIQRALAALEFLPDPPTGRFDAATRQALETWAGIENLEERLRSDDLLDPLLVDHLRAQAQQPAG